jgi:hypothetical protein
VLVKIQWTWYGPEDTTPSQIPSLKLDIKFELPLYNGEVNAEKLDNWIRQIEVYSRIQKIQDDETKI